MRNRLAAVLVALGLLVTATACSEIADPDVVGLYYMQGDRDGYKFDHCIDPGKSDDAIWNNSVVWLPNNLRTWNIQPQGGDSDRPITVATKPEPNQPSGVQVNVWSQVNMMLNTNCQDGSNSVLVQFWERIGRRYKADEEAGWKVMLLNTVVPALEKSTRVVVRNYAADPTVAGTNLPDIQQAVSAEFGKELRRLVGGDFFCGPTFNRATKECPPVEVLVKDVDYTDPGIQQARNNKQKALEDAAAKVAAAQGEVDAANKLESLYRNGAWLELEKAKIQLKIAEACGQNPNCQMIMGSDGTIITTK
jgi:hypothetical protein